MKTLNIKKLSLGCMVVFVCLSAIMENRLAAQTAKSLFETDQCIACHLELELMPEDFHEDDVHLKEGLSCAGCHGGDANLDDEEEAKGKGSGFVAFPPKAAITSMCAKCHSDIGFMREWQPRIATDQAVQYQSSVHGKLLQTGDEKVADCTSCHNVHSIFPAKDPRSSVYAGNVPGTCKNCHSDEEYMADYSIPTSQYDDFVASVHGKALLENHDLGAPACNDCHGNHGAAPPDVNSVNNVCGSCHVHNQEYFSQSVMAAEFATEDSHGCEECHNAHDVAKTFDEMVGVGEQSLCIDCHEEDEGYEAAEKIYNMLTAATAAYDSAAMQRDEVHRIGMDDVDIVFMLQSSHQSIIQARTLVHTFEPAAVEEKTAESILVSREASALAGRAMKDFDRRRFGFGIASLFITILVVSLIFKIREIEKG